MILLLATILAACANTQDGPEPGRESVVLQHVMSGEPEPEVDAIASLRLDGAVVSAGEILLAAASPKGEAQDEDGDPLDAWREWLAQVSPTSEDGPGHLLLRVEANAPFARCAELLGALDGWTVSLAVADVRAPDLDPSTQEILATTAPRRVLPLPRLGALQEARYDVRLHVAEEGRRLMRTRLTDQPWDGRGRFRWDQGSRRVVFSLGPNAFDGYSAFAARLRVMRGQLADGLVSISAGPGVTTGEVLLAIDALRSSGAGSVAWTPFESSK